MRLVRWTPLAAVGLALIALAPGTLAAAPPVHGTVTSCSSRVDCQFSFNTSAGTGWATAAPPVLSLQLPGESVASYNLTYSTYIALLTGTYTYWTVGTFLGTDVNTGHVILGQTNTNYTITCHGHSGRGGGCTYTYTTDNGTIVVRFTQAEITSTAISCSPTSIKVAAKTTCTVTVTDGWNSAHIPTGKVKITDGRTGALSNKGTCTLANGTCSFTFRPSDNTCGSVTIAASYLGVTAFYKSAASTSVYITTVC